MGTALTERTAAPPAPTGPDAAWTREQIDLVKRTVAKGATDDELRLFQHVCERTGLDPFLRQVHAVKRWDGRERREVMSIQTGIDGLRLIAERTGCYAPGREPSYQHEGGRITAATSYVKKLTRDGTWHEVAATALYDEYVQTTKDGQPTRFWQRMPHVMLAKVAEALALRRAFPAEMSGLYTHDEMTQADDERPATPPRPAAPEPAALPPPASRPATSDVRVLKRKWKELVVRMDLRDGDGKAQDYCETITGKRSSQSYTADDWRAVVDALHGELDGDGEPGADVEDTVAAEAAMREGD